MFKELEYKFKTNLTYQELLGILAVEANKIKVIYIEGRDYYFSGISLDSFVRYRDGRDSKELTFKQKLNGSNTLRTEVDLKLDNVKQFKEVVFFLEKLDYSYSFNLMKKGVVLELDNHVLSLYTVSTLVREDETFIEIEIDKKYMKDSENKAEQLLETLVDRYENLGVIEKSNIEKRSLYELFKPTLPVR